MLREKLQVIFLKSYLTIENYGLYIWRLYEKNSVNHFEPEKAKLLAEISLNEKTGARLARVERDGEDFSASINSINLTETQNIVKILKEMGNQNRNFDTLHQTNSGNVFRFNREMNISELIEFRETYFKQKYRI